MKPTYRRPRKQKTIVLDADGTIFEYDHWRGETHVGRPIPGAVEFTRMADWLGYDIVVSTARTGLGLESIRAAVEMAGMAAKEVTNQKPVGIAYVDDRGVRFAGDWKAAVGDLAEMLNDPELLVWGD